MRLTCDLDEQFCDPSSQFRVRDPALGIDAGVHLPYGEVGFDDLCAEQREHPLHVGERRRSSSWKWARSHYGDGLALERPSVRTAGRPSPGRS